MSVCPAGAENHCRVSNAERWKLTSQPFEALVAGSPSTWITPRHRIAIAWSLIHPACGRLILWFSTTRGQSSTNNHFNTTENDSINWLPQQHRQDHMYTDHSEFYDMTSRYEFHHEGPEVMHCSRRLFRYSSNEIKESENPSEPTEQTIVDWSRGIDQLKGGSYVM